MTASVDDNHEPAWGGCLCGAVRFKVTPPSRFCSHCHCGNCRRAHGAAFVTYVGYPAAQYQVLQGQDDLVRYATSTGATRSFCRRCGTTLTYEGPRWKGEVHVARACIDGPIDRAPGSHVYVDHAAFWWGDEDLPQFGGTSGMEKQ